MVKRTVNMGSEEPDKGFINPSEKEHCFQIVDVLEDFNNDIDIVFVKCEVVGGEENGRSLLQRLSLDQTSKGFFATRLLLKAIGEEYKGDKIDIDTDSWIGCRFYSTVVHNGKYANIDEYNFEKKINQFNKKIDEVKKEGDEVAWDDDVK